MPELEALAGIAPARSATAPDAGTDQAILCPDGSGSIRWAPGERLQHLFEDRCDRLAELKQVEHPAVQ